MKFLTCALLVTVVSGMRLQTTQPIQANPINDNQPDSIEQLISSEVRALLKYGTEDLEKWFMEEVQSDDGLTWAEFKDKMGQIAHEHNYKPTEKDWDVLNKIFRKIDKNSDGAITAADFTNECNKP